MGRDRRASTLSRRPLALLSSTLALSSTTLTRFLRLCSTDRRRFCSPRPPCPPPLPVPCSHRRSCLSTRRRLLDLVDPCSHQPPAANDADAIVLTEASPSLESASRASVSSRTLRRATSSCPSPLAPYRYLSVTYCRTRRADLVRSFRAGLARAYAHGNAIPLEHNARHGPRLRSPGHRR